MGSISDEKKVLLEELKEHMPEDVVPGYSVASSADVDPPSPWVNKMKKFSKDLNTNAYAYFNFDTSAKGGPKKRNRTIRRILSAEGFPPSISVSYAYPPPFAHGRMINERPIKYFCMHSFGHGWHGQKRGGKAIGWMNTTRKGRGVIPIELDGRTVYIPKGSDPESMGHFKRFSAGLRACTHSAAVASAHFFIDRDGNLVVLGSCNDIMYTSPGINRASIGVEMEEAFYVLKDTKGKGNKAIWRPGGRPAATAGNIEYFSYSPQQMFTLSILIRKLEEVYPNLQARNLNIARHKFDSSNPPGYTMHDFLKPPKGRHGHVDISPHFLDTALWDAFFRLVDKQDHITSDMVFLPAGKKYHDADTSQIVEPLSSQTLTAMTERMYNFAKDTGAALDRSASLALVSKKTVNSAAGKNATRSSQKTAQQVSNILENAQKTQNPIRELPVKNIPTGADGQQVGSDDFVY